MKCGMSSNSPVFNITDKDQLAIASGVRNQNRDENSWYYGSDYYSKYESIDINWIAHFYRGIPRIGILNFHRQYFVLQADD